MLVTQKLITELPFKLFFLQPWIFTDITLVLYMLQVLANKVNIPCRVVSRVVNIVNLMMPPPAL
jgi:hypothetical protein